MSIISVLLPTRKRTKLAQKSLETLINKAEKPEEIEILLAVDSDDTETLEWLKSDFVENSKIKILSIVFERLGYHQMHKYLNQLTKVSKGDWLFFWNDDAVMISNNWDAIVRQMDGTFAVLRTQVTNHPHPYALFPIVPREWYTELGFLSDTCQSDRYIYEVATKIQVQQCMINIPVYMEHDRFDLTGQNKDEVYDQRVYMEGDRSNPLHADSPQAQASVWRSSMKLSKFLMERNARV